ncbi:DUF4345 domain-containing protein [Pelagibacterium sp.]|uniref:DUF4345 domain-containing protein n=1 Tax=Pelagibacterium sp. TaxID=1967288 RepID=UPI003A902411
MGQLEVAYLSLAGAVALLIGAGMVFMPAPFYGSYGIELMESVDLANELRSPGLWLALVGVSIGVGTFRRHLRSLSLGIATMLYLSYAAARSVSIALDGLPGTGLLIAMAAELLLGLGGAFLVWRHRKSAR